MTSPPPPLHFLAWDEIYNTFVRESLVILSDVMDMWYIHLAVYTSLLKMLNNLIWWKIKLI